MSNLVGHDSSRLEIRRSLSGLAVPARLHRHQPRHPASHGRLQGNDRAEPRAELMRHSVDLLRPDAAAVSPDHSRRASWSQPRGDAAEADAAVWRENLRLEREKASVRQDILKRSLADLSAFSTSITKQLDDTYYAVLEKTSTLQNTVASVNGLAETLRGTCDSFDEDSRALESDTLRQVIAMGHFEAQEAKISGLQSRILQGRTRIQKVTDRVDTVRRRIEGWERADEAWREKTRKRLKIMWSVTSVVTILFVALVVGAHYMTRGLGDIGAGSTPSKRPLSSAGGSAVKEWATRRGDDDQLRLLDEL
ncbi:hypothetical protein XA68_14872 [Ophiocordyceps unilateralis]|uniref:Uncharacterized protein n=1 Tax=Ophiocordyceps unilateralis TaxID=268505 RepID=A0A2A9P9G5_OPHUN|nr:hypothetical protein XA68_14872 [Ophiocordyceps unilateralis]